MKRNSKLIAVNALIVVFTLIIVLVSSLKGSRTEFKPVPGEVSTVADIPVKESESTMNGIERDDLASDVEYKTNSDFQAPAEKTSKAQTPSANKTNNGTPAEILENSNTEEVIKIESPVGELKVPSEPLKDAEIKDTSSSDSYSKSFYTTVQGKQVLLYELVIGNDEEGYFLGTLPDENGDRKNVCVKISPIDKDPSWTDEEYQKVNEMQSTVNDLMSEIYDSEGFRE